MVTPVLSGSMRPGFSVGGVVISERTPLKDITVRDVIVFQNPYKHTEQMIHRIIKLTREPGGSIKIKTKGDDNPIPDPWTILIETRYVYQIKASVPLIGYFAVAYQDNRGLFVMVAGLLLLSVPGGLWLRSRAERRPEEQDEEGSELEPAGASSARRRATALAASGDGRRRSGSHASGWGLRWRKRAGDPAHLTAPAHVLRPYRIAIRALSVALIAAVALLGASVYQDYAWILVTVAGLAVLGVAVSTLLAFPKRSGAVVQLQDSVQPTDSDTAEPATVEEPVIALPTPVDDAKDRGPNDLALAAPPTGGAPPEDEDATKPTAVEELVGPSPVGAGDIHDGGPAEAAQPAGSDAAGPVAVEEPAGGEPLGAADTNGHAVDPMTTPEQPRKAEWPSDRDAIEAAAAETPVGPGSVHGEETVAGVAGGGLELLGHQREPVDAGAGRR